MTRAQKRQTIIDALLANPERSNRMIAATVSVDVKTVVAVRQQMIAAGEIPQFNCLTGNDGKQRPASNAHIMERRRKQQEQEETDRWWDRFSRGDFS